MNRSTLLNTDTEDLKELLSNGKSYTVPPYQRDYSWRQEHWEDLWEDLLTIEESKEDHYMGAVVLETGERKQFRIIDGQQRIATLSILIIACVDFLNDLARNGIDAAANSERASLLESSYIGAKDPASLQVTPKIRLNANDNDFFQLNLAQRISPRGGLRRLRGSERKLWDCFSFFKDKVSRKFIGDLAGEKVATFISETVTERLVFISVRVQDQLSAYTVFETLNARGLELTETDLLKNYLLSLADRLSSTQIDPILQKWSRITLSVGVEKFPEFLRHHLNSKRPFVRQKQLFKVIKSDITTLPQVFALLDELEDDAAWFEGLSDHMSDFWLDYPGAGEHVRVLNLFGVSQYTPLILAAKRSFSSVNDINDILRYCAVVSVRFNGVGHRSTHILEEVYNRAALAIRSGESSTLQDIRRSLRSIYILDDEFVADFSTLRMKSRGLPGKRLRYLLACIERQMSGMDVSDRTMQATVEHVLPVNPSDGEWEEFSAEAHERSVDRVGNYSLLERSLNAQDAANAAFAEKRPVYQQSQYVLSRELCGYDDWTEETIAGRQTAMARVAKCVWAIDLPRT